MQVLCAHCQTVYRVAAAKLTRDINRVRCSRCQHVFFVPRQSRIDRTPTASEPNAPRCRIVAVSNQKGGVAKTSTCLNLGVSLARLGRRVLLIDFDPQANLTLSLGFREMHSFYETLGLRAGSAADFVVETRFDKLHLLPSGSSLERFESEFAAGMGVERILRERMDLLRQGYDTVLIDTPPSMGICTRNALFAADLVLVPTLCEYFSTYGVNRIQKAIEDIRLQSGSDLDYRLLVVQYDPGDPSRRAVYRKLQEGFGDRIYKSLISYDAKMKASQILKQAAIEYDPASPSGLQYEQLAHEILDGAAAEAVRTVA